MSKGNEAKKDPVGDALHALTAPATTASAKSAAPVLDAETPTAKKSELESVTSLNPLVPRQKRVIPQARFRIRGYLHNTWDVTVERGTTLRDVLDHDFWKHVAAQLRPHDLLEVLSEDGTWYARLLVINADRVWAKVFKLEYHDLTASYTDMPKTQEEEYEVDWTAMGKYSIRKKGQQGMAALKEGFETRLDAYQWLDGHLKTINA